MFRCELCDNILSIFQISKLCNICYEIRTIVKVYNCKLILEHLRKNFLIKQLKENDSPELILLDNKKNNKQLIKKN